MEFICTPEVCLPKGQIQSAAFSFTLIPKETMILPAYKGSTLRGAFGHTFRRIVCVGKAKDCADCILRERCVYSYVFETPPPAGTKMMRKYEAAPHPFVIEPPPERRRGYRPGEEIRFGLVLIGRAIDYLPYFIYTFDEMGKRGLGSENARFSLTSVESGGRAIYDGETKKLSAFDPQAISLDSNDAMDSTSRNIRLSFVTPTRFVINGQNTMDLDFQTLTRILLRRLSLLYYFHCGGDPSPWDFRGIIERAGEVKVSEKNLRWWDWERYSNRQETKIKMGGFVGESAFEGDLGPFMPLLRAGEVLHVGKGTGFGLGKYEINYTDKGCHQI
ncbi:MAG: CRISPR system precrRNA processing endoribonuclease RAMP protein Cas6 [Nitrospirales bacterium]|nr:CRISPR system precrRNA processing endoribonuclease RAMP protein Cas6 [Nitrospirales bacterium]